MDIIEILISGSEYPESLRNIAQPPKQIFIRGEILPQDKNAIGIVGTRKCTPYGKKAAYDLAFRLAKLGITIVSGLAFGVDAEAHKGALDAGGRTIAVLGTGVDDKSIYPHTHKSLAEQIMKNGAVISEFEPGTVGYPGNFPQRNRIISALSLGVIVVEAAEKSGSLITANYALEQGKEVFAVPGPIYSQVSAGANKLIQQGAKLITKAEDVLEEFGWQIEAVPTSEVSADTLEEQMIISNIAEGISTPDKIIQNTKLPSASVLTLLTMLELKNKIKNIGNNIYVIEK